MMDDTTIVSGKIESVAFGGEGILRHEGLVIFVPFTCPGDLVKVQIHSPKKRFAKGKCVAIEKPGELRTPAACSYFGTCGGCQLQHIDYSGQLQIKKKFLVDALERIGKITPPPFEVKPATDQWDYRRHIRLQLHPVESGFQAGYIATDNRTLLTIKQCPIFIKNSSSFFESLDHLVKQLDNVGIESASVRILKGKAGKYLLAFDFFPHLPKNYSLAENAIRDGSPWQGILFRTPTILEQWGDTTCMIETLGISAHFSPYGFVQNHPEQSDNLYKVILNSTPDDVKKIIDLYCGIGITSLLLAQKGIKVSGVESHEETVQMAQKNAGNKVDFHCGRVEKEGIALLEKEKPDLVLCNPPRTGMHPKLIQALNQYPVDTLLYVSCMPGTLSRDLHLLTQGSYQLDKIEAFDMFPQTTHVETLTVLKKINHRGS